MLTVFSLQTYIRVNKFIEIEKSINLKNVAKHTENKSKHQNRLLPSL